MDLSKSRRRLAGLAGIGALVLAGGAQVALANGPTSSQLKAIGSSSKAAHTQPSNGLTATPSAAPLIAVSFIGNKATVIGGSAVPGSGAADARAANVPVSAVQCTVNFTTKKTPISSSSVSARWFSGVGCSRNVELFGQAFLAESASKFDGTGNYYKGNLKTASSGRSNTTVKAKNPSLYVYSATNIYFPEKPSRGVIVVVPAANQPINSATRCGVVKSSSWGFGVHCDMYTNRF